MPDTIKNFKQQLRREILLKRRALPVDFVTEGTGRISDFLLEWPVYKKAATVMIYLAMPDEPGTDAIIEKALADGKQVCVPLLRQEYGYMDAARIKGLDDLVIGRMSLKMPNPASCEIVDPADVDLIIVPGVAFDLNGNRLGMGAGYYDRFLEEMDEIFLLGLAWSFQVLPNVPSAEHDIKMQQLLTEDGFLPVRRVRM
ncbi:MAG: yqgN [Firmicutes bacterium]|nr:yqgN [Bacillota bacterium]